jgi:hypothetical protein
MNALSRFRTILGGNGGRKHKQIEYDEYTVIKPPVKRELQVLSSVIERQSLVIICERELADQLNEQYGSSVLVEWHEPNVYEIFVNRTYDFYEVVRYVKARYE